MWILGLKGLNPNDMPVLLISFLMLEENFINNQEL